MLSLQVYVFSEGREQTPIKKKKTDGPSDSAAKKAPSLLTEKI